MTNRRTPISDFARFLRTETVGGMVMLAATAIALVWANSPIGDSYRGVRDTQVGTEFLHLNLTLGDWAKDGLLALFFFVVGLELKRELVIGELSKFKAALLPVIAAIGGMVVPAVLALVIASGDPRAGQIWPIPVATDIAFALGVLALTARHMPSSARIFLLSLAVVDDLGAIALIATLFTSDFDFIAFGAALALLALYWFLQRKRVTSAWLYVPLGIAVWIAVHSSGIHATVAGVALGLLTRVRKDPGEEEAPALRLEHRLQPWSAGVAVPVFALFAAGVPVGAAALSAVFTERIGVAIMVGLVVGKLVGIVGFSLLAVKFKLAAMPSGLSWRDISAVAMLGGVGFTVSLLIAELSLSDADAELAKAAVLIASAAASLMAAALLAKRSKVHADS